MILETENLVKRFGGLRAVDDVSITVKEEDIHAIIGPNGAGKTTLFNVITKYLEPDAGQVRFMGQDITAQRPHEICRLGLVRCFQRASVYPKLTVFQSVQMAVLSRHRKWFSMWRAAERQYIDEVGSILEKTGLVHQSHALGDELSQGDKKRLDIAMALGCEPKLLLLDEPTAGMSQEETHTTIRLLERLNADLHLTILFTEHDMSVVFGIARRVTVMHQGRVVADGSPEEVRRDSEVQRIYLGAAQ